MKRSFRLLLIGAVALTGGCRNTCCRKQSARYVTTPPPGATIITPQPQPLPPGVSPPAEVLPPAAPPPGVGAAPTGVAPAPRTPSGYAPIAKLDPAAPAQSVEPAVHLLAPELGETVAPAAAAEPAPAESKSPAPALPAGIPDFAPALSDRVSNGRKPMLDGLDWLKTNGYRGALLLRAPGASESADRKQFEDRGIKFASLEVALSSLSRGTVDEFNRLVAEAGRQPQFVYDADGSLTGPLWYLYFRRVEKLDDEAARARAERLGLRMDDKDKRLSWLAVQDFLSRNP